MRPADQQTPWINESCRAVSSWCDRSLRRAGGEFVTHHYHELITRDDRPGSCSAKALIRRRLLCQNDASTLPTDIVKHLVERAARRAQLTPNGGHRLRHTFCSHFAMRGAPATVIQEFAGHKDVSTTQRYMHLSPAAIRGDSVAGTWGICFPAEQWGTGIYRDR